jgi:hypothetical protein
MTFGLSTSTATSTAISTVVPPTATRIPPTATSVPWSATPAPPGATATTPTATATAAVCAPALSFSDVHPSDDFYVPVHALACQGVISGYSDGTFRPSASATRGQIAKIVHNAITML